MDLTDEIKFGDIQKEERYKKLQRNLKLIRMKQAKLIKEADFNLENKLKTNFHLKGSERIQSSPWPSCSSINADPSDFNYTSSSLQTSRTGSEILTSCFHLKNLISKKSFPHKPMATSSVKQFSETEQSIGDRAIMPPPSSSNIIRPPSKRSAPTDSMLPPIQSRQSSSYNDDPSSHGKQSPSDINSSSDHPEDSGCAQDLNRGKPVIRDFYRWRVFLNDQGQLLIKGALENGKIARSKPVLKMLSSTKVESIFRHTYCLHGNIVDDKNELPKYVYSKFYNGFPDDWENVHQIWKNYIAQGSIESYRWPMNVSLSDDDLNSVITDVTHLQKTVEKKCQEPSSIDKSTPQRSSGYSSDLHQERNSKSSENSIRDSNLNLHFSKRNETAEVLNMSNEKEKENRSQFENSNDRSRGNLYAALDYAQSLKDIIFEDKLTIITQILLHENCPKEYVRNVNRTIEYLNYLISYKIVELDESATKRPRIETKNDSRMEDFQRNCSTPLYKPNEQILNLSKQVSGNDVVEKKSNLESNMGWEKLETSPKVVNPQMVNSKMNSDISESETYAGIPKIPPDRIFQFKSYYARHKGKKFERNLKSNKAQINTGDCKTNLAYDSAMSLTEEEMTKNYEDDKESKTRSDSNNVQLRLNVSGLRTDHFKEDTNPDPLRQNREIGNRAPLEVLRKAYFEENRTRMETLNMPKYLTLIDKENMETNKQTGLSEPLQRKESQNLQTFDLSSNRGKQKPTMISSEVVDLLPRLKRPLKNQIASNESGVHRQGQREKEERQHNVMISKTAEELQDSEKNTPGNIQKNAENDSFGMEKNPKPLESWTPLVTFDGKGYHLVFEGTLMNAVGQPMKKKFISGHVVRRVSSAVIETADHQFYKLVGEFHNSKHALPKELLSQCRNGCPAKIDQFCANWIKLTGENNVVVDRSQKNSTEHTKNGLSSSSRGRKILPPLSFWAGERVFRKDNIAIYKPGEPKNEFVSSAIASPKKPRNAQDQESQTNSTKVNEKKSGSNKVDKKSRATLLNEGHVSSNEAIQGSSDFEQGEHHVKNKVAHRLFFSSSDSEEEEKINKRLKIKSRKNFDFNETPPKSERKLSRQNQNSKSANPYRLRKRKKIQYDTDIESDSDEVQQKRPGKSRTSQTVRCTYQKNVPNIDATLSDDLASIV